MSIDTRLMNPGSYHRLGWCIACEGKPFQRLCPHPHFHFFFTLSGRIFHVMATTTRDAVEELLQTYGETGGINYLAAAASLPSRLSIEAACTELMSLMFPGFRSEALVNSEDLADTTRIRVRHLHARLKTEICRSLGKIPPDEATEAKAEEVLSEFFKQLPSVRRHALDGHRRGLRRRPGRDEL